MGKYTQDGRGISITTPLGQDKLLLESFAGEERISGLFRYAVEMLAESTTDVAFDKLLGQPATIKILLPDKKERYLSGIISQVSQGHQVAAAGGGETFIRYRAEIVPSFWLLTRRTQSRIFQQKSVPDILKVVLAGLDVAYQTQGTFQPRDYCVQYRESDFAFASRLMEEEGIFYTFKHTASSHSMILANNNQSFAELSPAKVIFDEVGGSITTDYRVHAWEKLQELRSRKVTLWDQCFELPLKHLEATENIQATVKAGTVTHKHQLGPNENLELYDFPGQYAQRFDGVDKGGGEQAAEIQKIFEDNKRTTKIRMEQDALPGLIIAGQSDCRHFTAGGKFTLDRHFNADGSYLITNLNQRARMPGAYLSGGKATLEYVNAFQCLPSAVPFRPARTTPKPRIDGVQTAVVVGPKGEEIVTDKYGRVKVQFPWDRDGKYDASSSCWCRVATTWSGKQWGTFSIPRVGMEVVVAFEEGDPDTPLIVGTVYNADNMRPYKLPDFKTQSGIKSRSTLSGDDTMFNELRFEDKKDSEEIYFHAEKDFNRVVENNDTLKVGFDKAKDGNQTIEIYNDQSLKVGQSKAKAGSQTIEVWKDRTLTVKTGNETTTIEKGNRTATVKTGNETLNVDTGNREVTVKTGNDTHNVNTGNRTVTIKTGNDELTINTGNLKISVTAGSTTMMAGQKITLTVGGSTVEITPSSVEITSPQIKMTGQVTITGPVSISGPSLSVTSASISLM